jgi:hypothetical protein
LLILAECGGHDLRKLFEVNGAAVASSDIEKALAE